MKSADVEKCQGVKRYRMLGNRKQIYIYMDIYVCHCWRSVKSIFHQGEDFYQGQGFFEFTSANFFDRERERETILFFFARLNSKKEKSFAFLVLIP